MNEIEKRVGALTMRGFGLAAVAIGAAKLHTEPISGAGLILCGIVLWICGEAAHGAD